MAKKTLEREERFVPDDVRVLVDPSQLFKLAIKNRKELEDARVLVAERKDKSVGIYVTLCDDGIFIRLDVLDEKGTVETEPVMDADDCYVTFWRLLCDHLTDDVDYVYGVPHSESASDDEDTTELEIQEREQEVSDAFMDFLGVVADLRPEFFEGDDEEFFQMLDEVLTIIGTEHEYSVYRPMYYKGKLYEYPYNEVAPEDKE